MTPELTTDTDDERDEDPRVIELPTDRGTVRARFPSDASEGEAAAIAAAVVAHLDGEEAEEEEPAREFACPWAVAGRLEPATGRRPRRRAELPGDCPRGAEWRFAANCR